MSYESNRVKIGSVVVVRHDQNFETQRNMRVVNQSINQSIKIYFLSNRNITVYYSMC